MAELINFRDFGDQPGAPGKIVRADRLYRCGHLAALDEDVVARTIALDFALVADLRYPDERASIASPWPDRWADRILCHDAGDRALAPHVALFDAAIAGPEAVDRTYLDIYRSLPIDPPYRALFAEGLARIAEADGRVLIHCTAGKDRTGVLAALLLAILGVPRRAILADYMRSADAPGLRALRPGLIARARRAGRTLTDEAAAAMLGVKAGYLATAFAEIDARCGSLDAYLDEGGVDAAVRERLRARLLAAA